MKNIRLVMRGCIAASFVLAVPAFAQATAPVVARGRHLVVVKLVERPGNKVPFAFEPGAFTAERGDTLRFVQASNTMHNVHFKTKPKGAKLGAAAMSPYLTTMGQAYNSVVDSRFTTGNYEIMCDPHQALGMHGFLTVLTLPGT